MPKSIWIKTVTFNLYKASQSRRTGLNFKMGVNEKTNRDLSEANLPKHVQKITHLDETDMKRIDPYLKKRTIRKKEHLLKEGQVCSHYYFILKGCLRCYIINQRGNEQTLQFGIENWWLSDYISFENSSPSHFYIQAVEPTDVLEIDKTDLELLLKEVPAMERYFRLMLQKASGAAQMRIKYLFTMSAEERYHHFNTAFPNFVQRVPQYMLASYLDFSPELMSKIRAGKM